MTLKTLTKSTTTVDQWNFKVNNTFFQKKKDSRVP